MFFPVSRMENCTIVSGNSSGVEEGCDRSPSALEIITIIFCGLGIIGNILNYLVFRRRSFSYLSVSVFLRMLALMDIFVLLIKNVGEIELKVRMTKDPAVKDYQFNPVIIYLMLCCAGTSAWMIVLISIERAIALTFPLHVKVIFTKKRAFILSVFTFMIMFILFIPMLVVKRKEEETFPLPEYYAVVYTMLPSVIVISCNLVAIRKLCKRPTLGNLPIENRGTTIMLIVNSIAFVVLTLLYPLYRMANRRSGKRDKIGDILLLCNGLNHMLNFVFYGLSGEYFRRELNGLFCCREDKGRFTTQDSSQGRMSNYYRTQSGRSTTSSSMRNTRDRLDILNDKITPKVEKNTAGSP